MPPTCPRCSGTGYSLGDEGGVTRAVACECRTAGRAERLLAATRIPPRYRDCELSNFDLLSDDLRRARNLAREYVEAFPDVEGGLMFLGPPGVGKTHLAVAILKEVVQSKGARGLFCGHRDLLKTIQATYDPSVEASELSVLGPVVRAPVLVLDDLGSGRPTGWVRETVSYILSSRYNERLVTIVTSNFPDAPSRRDSRVTTLEMVVGGTVLSRLREMCRVVEISDAADYRKEIRGRSDLHPL